MTRITLLSATALVSLGLTTATLGTPAFAADPPPPPQTASAPLAAASTPAFVKAVAAGNLFEIESSRLALTKAGALTVKHFAQQMIDDHTKAGERFRHALEEAKVEAPEAVLDDKHRAVLDSLKSTDAAGFDKAYVEAQFNAHVETVALFKAYSTAGDNGRMKQFADELLPTLQKHLDEVSKMR
ncbi:DUF4142 domain-containing protein [Reyranella sp.]|uniref:DUF4142 domain-containing protein n=1 Tax=Reyranella sp. TaxID=1929291 RepID=UPI003BAD453D